VRTRLAIFAAVCVVAATATLVQVVHSRHAVTKLASAGASPVSAQRPLPAHGLDQGSYLLFRSTAPDRDFGRLALVGAEDPSGPRALTSLTCDRVDYEGDRGLCLTRPRSGVLESTTSAIVFDAHFNKLHTVPLVGYPSRARVSPDGRYGAVTSFVNGDSYATMGLFSTRTDIIDLRTGKILFDLEKMQVRRNGAVMHATDFNFWGVTFANRSPVFYATLGTGGHTYLIQGNLSTRQATVLRSDVECPSLSPDNRQIVFKKRLPGTVVSWRLSVLDLATLTDHPLAETHSVDDQADWLDDNTIIYGLIDDPAGAAAISAANPGPPLLTAGASITTDTWAVPADGSGTARLLTKGTWSMIKVTQH
jgi:hypothetical protein